MVNTRQLEKLMGRIELSEPDHAPVKAARYSLALSGRRGGRPDSSVPLALSRSEASAESNWIALTPAEPADDIPSRLKDLNQLAQSASMRARFDVLRGQLMQRFGDQKLTCIGLAAPHRGAGASFTMAGLVGSFARRKDLRVVALDLDPIAPSLHMFLEVEQSRPITELVAGYSEPQSHLRRLGEGVALGLGQVRADEDATALSPQHLRLFLDEIRKLLMPDLILCDLPPLLEGDLGMSMASQMDATLLIVDSGETAAEHVRACEVLMSGQTSFLGLVLNHFRGRSSAS